MSIEIIVRDYRGIASAEIECAPIALLAGPNGAGKSSIAEAAAACLTGHALAARLDVDKKEAGQVVRDGATGSGFARVIRKVDGADPAQAQVSWPECALRTTGEMPPHASPFALGQLHDLLYGRPAERAAIIQRYLKSTPTKADLYEAMIAAADFADEAVNKLWGEIERLGWDSAATAQDALRGKANQDWRKLTGTTFGSEKARTWRPDGWDPLLEGTSPASIEAMIAASRAALEEALKTHAVDEAERTRLQLLANQKEARATILAAAKLFEEEKDAELGRAMGGRKGLPIPIEAAGYPCPHCGEKVMVIGEGASIRLSVYEGVSPADNNTRRTAIKKANDAIGDATKAKDDAIRARITAETELEASETATAAILAAGGGERDASRVEALRAEVAQRETELRLVITATAARKEYLAWLSADIKLGLLSPAGLRAKKLIESIAAFNTGVLAPLAKSAEWGPVEMVSQNNLIFQLGGRRYGLLSSGEQWRVRAVLQAALATLDGSDLVIIDDTPDLDEVSRNGLYWLMQETGLHALVCMATVPGLKVPDLAAAGFGKTYMVADLTARPLNGSASNPATSSPAR